MGKDRVLNKIIRLCNEMLTKYQIVRLGTGEKIIIAKPENYFQDGMYIENQSNFRFEPSFRDIIQHLTEKIGIDYEMDWRTYIAMELSVHAGSIEGDFVELGSGEGWIINALMMRNPAIAQNREIHLFDKFDGLEVNMKFGENKVEAHPRYPDNIEKFIGCLEIKKNVFVHSAILPDGLDVLTNRIAFLHVDLNAAQTEVESLRKIYPLISPGGVVLLDDYCGRGRQVQHRAMNILAGDLGINIVSLPTGQGLILKDLK